MHTLFVEMAFLKMVKMNDNPAYLKPVNLCFRLPRAWLASYEHPLRRSFLVLLKLLPQ